MIIVYDSPDRKNIRSISSSSYDVKWMILLLNGYLASCADNKIKIWNVGNGSLRSHNQSNKFSYLTQWRFGIKLKPGNKNLEFR